MSGDPGGRVLSRMEVIEAMLAHSLLLISAVIIAPSTEPVSFEVRADKLVCEGHELSPIDDAAVFFAEPFADTGAAPLPALRPGLAETIAERGLQGPVRCRLVDYVDCTTVSHDFADDEGSHVLELGGDRYRVTAVPHGFELKWFSYVVKTAGTPGVPHLLVAQLINDQERYTTLTLTVPSGEHYPEPYTGQETPTKKAMDFCEEPDCFHPDVGSDVYTGCEWPVDGQPFVHSFVFYPKTETMLLTVSSSGWNLHPNDQSGAAVARIWVFEILDSLTERAPKITPPLTGNERRIGVYTTHPWYYLAHYGYPANTRIQRAKSLDNMMQMMQFEGFNLLAFNAINGADRAVRAWYPDSYYPMLAADLLSELPPVARKYDMKIIPVVTSITCPYKGATQGTNKYGFSVLSFQRGGVEGQFPNTFGEPAPDPMRPEVQQWLIKHVVEVAERCKGHDCYEGVGFRVNGKIGLCYVAWEDKSGKETKVRPAKAAGYSPWNLEQFRTATGIDVPTDSKQAYEWLQARPKEWDAWLDFRCKRTHTFWLRVRDAIRAINPDWKLYVMTDLPAEVPATNVEWPGPDASDAEQVSLDLLRAHGLDPRMFKDDEGIVIQRVMMIDADRFWSKWDPPWGANADRYRLFHFQPFLQDWYRTPGGSAVELYHNYWEEPHHPQAEFGPDDRGFGLRTATATAIGRGSFRPMTFAVRTGNVGIMTLLGWERPTLGQEHRLRRFSQAFRALPVAEPRSFQGEVEVVSGPPATEESLQVAWYGDRLGIINDCPEPRTLRITLAKPIPDGHALCDVATGRELIKSNDPQRTQFTIELLMYDLRTLAVVESKGGM